jgi:hypothetical protein
MHQVEKDTSSGRDIREYECQCGHSDWEDRGTALWKILSDDREEFEASKASSRAPAEISASAPESAQRSELPASSGWAKFLASLSRLFKRKQ